MQTKVLRTGQQIDISVTHFDYSKFNDDKLKKSKLLCPQKNRSQNSRFMIFAAIVFCVIAIQQVREILREILRLLAA